MVSKNRPFLIFLNNAREDYTEKLVEELEAVGFKIQTFEKESLALKLLEKNNVHGIFITDSSPEKIKDFIKEIRKSENPVAIFSSLPD